MGTGFWDLHSECGYGFSAIPKNCNFLCLVSYPSYIIWGSLTVVNCCPFSTSLVLFQCSFSVINFWAFEVILPSCSTGFTFPFLKIPFFNFSLIVKMSSVKYNQGIFERGRENLLKEIPKFLYLQLYFC